MALTYHPDLIFDIGMHAGQDTAYYLYRGFNVVAVDANPNLCKKAEKTWPGEIQTGRLRIENVAIGDSRGFLPFYVSSNDLMSSFDRESAARQGCSYETIEITYLRAADLFAKYGVPYYLKIDIEGADTYCLQDLDAACLPKFVSFECGPSAPEDVSRLCSLGYRRFKLINQSGLEFRSEYEREPKSQEWRRRARRKLRNIMHGRWKNDWPFELGSSGPFGDDADGPWMNAEKLLKVRDRWRKLDTREGHSFWFDIHAGL